jgi:hypothetical protein
MSTPVQEAARPSYPNQTAAHDPQNGRDDHQLAEPRLPEYVEAILDGQQPKGSDLSSAAFYNFYVAFYVPE